MLDMEWVTQGSMGTAETPRVGHQLFMTTAYVFETFITRLL